MLNEIKNQYKSDSIYEALKNILLASRGQLSPEIGDVCNFVERESRKALKLLNHDYYSDVKTGIFLRAILTIINNISSGEFILDNNNSYKLQDACQLIEALCDISQELTL